MPPLFLLTKLQIMENYIPKNSINTPLKKNEKLERLKKENERVRKKQTPNDATQVFIDRVSNGTVRSETTPGESSLTISVGDFFG